MSLRSSGLCLLAFWFRLDGWAKQRFMVFANVLALAHAVANGVSDVSAQSALKWTPELGPGIAEVKV